MEERVRLLKSRAFDRFARSSHISDTDLWEAVERAEKGLIDANLGSGVIKQRIARDGKGKSGGFRSIIFYRSGAIAVFVFGFAKSRRSNIDPCELKTFKEAAKVVLSLTDKQLATAINNGAYTEVKKATSCYEQDGKEGNRV